MTTSLIPRWKVHRLDAGTADVAGRTGFREAIDALASVVSTERVVSESQAIEIMPSAIQGLMKPPSPTI